MTSEHPTAVGTATVDRPAGRGGGRHRQGPTDRPWAARPRLLGGLAMAVAVAAAGIALLVPAVTRLGDQDQNDQGGPVGVVPSQSAGPTASGQLVPRPVKVEFAGTLSWALVEESGRISGSANLSTPMAAASMLKSWIVADYLRQAGSNGRKPAEDRLAQARLAIRDGDAAAAESLNAASGGIDQIRRMIAVCRLTDTQAGKGWSRTLISARDAARLGRCLTDGRAAGPSWTGWVRSEMTKTRGGTAKGGSPRGMRWGVVDGLPEQMTAQGVGFENGWSRSSSSGQMRVNCLAVADGWALAVLTRYPAERGLTYGAEACADVATQLLPPAEPAT
ncbi:MAG TPA: hypothetical protein VHN18_07335 [Micromonosporaceae bacterium]|nr:hypothetical protein [Micromonosporaceae bacterium]